MGIDTIPEMFETYDEEGRPLGLVARDVVHREGIWHRASNVFLFRSNGDLVIQQRAESKDVCPNLWDVSVAEHLKPGEDFEAAAIRGLEEELGLRGIEVEKLGPEIRERLELPAQALKDYEMQQSFSAFSDASGEFDPGEVSATQEIPMDQLRCWMDASPEDFTPWFLHRVVDLGLLD